MSLLRTDNKLRLGGGSFGTPKDPQSLVDYHLKNGFSAAYDPGVEDPVQLEEIKAAYKEADIVIAEVSGFGANILTTDKQLLETTIDRLCNRIERAEKLEALCVVTHGGSVGRGPRWSFTPANFGQAAVDGIVKVAQRILDATNPQFTKFVLETESRILPDSPDVYLEILKGVDRPGFAVHLDPINITLSPRRYYFSGDFIRDCFAKLGPYIVSCHAKDIRMMRRTSQVCFEETFAGNGGLDFHAYITELVSIENDAPLMIEHCPTLRQQQWARDYIYEQAGEVDVPIRNAEFLES